MNVSASASEMDDLMGIPNHRPHFPDLAAADRVSLRPSSVEALDCVSDWIKFVFKDRISLELIPLSASHENCICTPDFVFGSVCIL